MLISKVLGWISDLFDGRTKEEKIEDEQTEQLLKKAWEEYEKNRITTEEVGTLSGYEAYALMHSLPSKFHCKHLRVEWSRRLYYGFNPAPINIPTPPPELPEPPKQKR